MGECLMSTTRIGSLMGFAIMAAATGSAWAAPDANAIMKKSMAAMSGAKTYQATIQMNTTMGPANSATASMDIKMVPAQGKLAVKMAPVGQATGLMAQAAMFMNMTMVDDGKNS